MLNNLKDQIRRQWRGLTGQSDDGKIDGKRREKLVAIGICTLLAFCLWMIVNLNRQYTINIDVLTKLGNITVNQSLATDLPDNVSARVTGSGWHLISLYKDPPRVYIDVSGDEVNLFEQVRQQVSMASKNVTVQTVNPLYLQVKLEAKKSKKVPVEPNVNLQTDKQYALLEAPTITPDSVTVRGAASRITGIHAWPTDSLRLNSVNKSITQKINLKTPNDLVRLSASSVTYHAEVAQFTEGEVEVPVGARDFPSNNFVTFSPSSVHVRYRIPLKNYAGFDPKKSFKAYVTFRQVQQDTTGFVTPEVEKGASNLHIKIRSLRPPEVAYFTIVGNDFKN